MNPFFKWKREYGARGTENRREEQVSAKENNPKVNNNKNNSDINNYSVICVTKYQAVC